MVGRWELQIWVGDEWQSVRPDVPLSMMGSPVALEPYRYEDNKDAQRMLDRLFPELPRAKKRIVRV